MILDKAPELVRAYVTVVETDEYNNEVPTVGEEFVEFKAFILPVGFSGAGWAINSKLQSQGFADVARNRVYWKPKAELNFITRWTRLEFRGRLWTVQEDVDLFVGARPTLTMNSATVELLGED